MKTSEHLLNEALEIKNALFRFLHHPMSEIKHVPDWPWARLLLFQIVITAVTGALNGLAEQRIFFGVFAGLFFRPVITLIMMGIATLFFYYCFQIFAEKTVAPRHLFTVVLFANIPQFLFQTIEGFVPPVALVGMAFTALLLLVGFVENFQLPRKLAVRLIAVLYAIFFALWLWNSITSSKFEKAWKNQHSDAPEVELGN